MNRGSTPARAKQRSHCLLFVLVTASATGCSEVGYEPEILDVSGQWTGTLILEDRAPLGIQMSLQQVGATVDGAVSIEGALSDASLDGTMSSTGLLRWGAHDGDCDLWTGQVAISTDHATLSGAAQVNESLCDDGSIVTGTVTLERS